MNKRFWLRLLIGGMVIAFVGSFAISGALAYGWARRPLLARLSKSFGRPVQVGHFSFSLLGGPTLEADSVSVDEDPRFGQEYFLRADQLTAGLRWAALLRGKVEFGNLLLTRPSLNLVHNADGHWNIESWLPPATGAGDGMAPSSGGANSGVRRANDAATERLRHIDVEGGRINFKLQADKLPFALTEVNGHVDQDMAGRWSLDLTAIPLRTSVALQDAGTLSLRGTVAGTSERLRPAALTLTWSDASLADSLRLAGGRDFGVRGTFEANLTARIADAPPASAQNAAAQWTFGGNVRLAGVHRWDLAGRAINPGLNLTFAAAWHPGESQIQISRWVVTAPHSRVEAAGAVNWSHGFQPRAQIAYSHIAFDDLLAWARAFAPSIADDLAIEGTVGVDATLADWPPRIERLELASEGAALRTGGAPAPLHVGPMEASLQRNTLVLAPVSITLPGLPPVAMVRPRVSNPSNQTTTRAELPAARSTATTTPPAGNFVLEGAVGPFRAGAKPRDWGYRIAVTGETQRTEDLAAVAVAFARPGDSAASANAANNSAELTALPATALPATDWTAEWLSEVIKDWQVSGPAALHLVWAGLLHRATTSVSGALELRSLRMSSALLNHPVIVSATVDLRPGERRVSIASAEAFGANWKGTLRKSGGEEWVFDLAADHLDAAELDRWLGPRARKGLLARMLPFAVTGNPESPRAAAMGSAVASLRARGRLRVAEVTLAPLRVERLDSPAELRGRNLTLRGAQADFYGGRVSGDFEARLSPDPAYSIRARIDRANLTDLAASTDSLTGRFGGLASGDFQLGAQGVGRDDLLRSMQGAGTLRVRDPLLNGLLPNVDAFRNTPRGGEMSSAAMPAPATTSPEDRFGLATASFRVAGEQIVVDEISLAGRDTQLEVRGTVDFAKRLDFHVSAAAYPRPGVFDSQDVSGGTTLAHDEWVGSGTLDAPRWTRSGSPAGNGAVAARARR